MGFFDDFFGGGGSESTSTSYLPKQKKWADFLLDLYGPKAGEGQPSYAGERVAQFSPEALEALDVGDYLKWFEADRDMPLFGETGEALSGILSGTTGAQKITPEAGEKFFSSAFEKPMRKAFTKYGRPGIRESYAGPGFWSGARAKAETEGAGEVEDWLGEQRGGLMWDIEQANRAIEEAKAGRALSAVGPAMQYGGQPTREAAARLAGRGGVFDFIEVERMQRQALINESMERFAESHREMSPEDLQIIMTLIGMNFSTSTSEASGPGLGYSMASGFMGGLGKGMGGAMMVPQTSTGGGGMPTGSPLEQGGTTIYV